MSMRQGGFGAPLPPALNPAQVYGFRPMSSQRYQELVGEGRAYTAELRVRLGIRLPLMTWFGCPLKLIMDTR